MLAFALPRPPRQVVLRTVLPSTGLARVRHRGVALAAFLQKHAPLQEHRKTVQAAKPRQVSHHSLQVALAALLQKHSPLQEHGKKVQAAQPRCRNQSVGESSCSIA